MGERNQGINNCYKETGMISYVPLHKLGTQGKDFVMENKEYDGPNRRRYTRIVYKRSQRPSLIVLNRELEIVDISEGGMRIMTDPDIRAFDRPPVQGTIMFLDGESIKIEGDIAWIIGNEVRLKFRNLIPSSRIKREQEKQPR
jgi:hypothetical protein